MSSNRCSSGDGRQNKNAVAIRVVIPELIDANFSVKVDSSTRYPLYIVMICISFTYLDFVLLMFISYEQSQHTIASAEQYQTTNKKWY